MIVSEKKENKNVTSTRHNSYYVIGQRSLVSLCSLAGLSSGVVVHDPSSFAKELQSLPSNTIIITSSRFKESVPQLSTFPYVVTFPDSLSSLDDMSDIKRLQQEVLGATGGK
ncbi:MAG: hypothetical protein ACQESC_04550 [Nanobdellota archaeon]